MEITLQQVDDTKLYFSNINYLINSGDIDILVDNFIHNPSTICLITIGCKNFDAADGEIVLLESINPDAPIAQFGERLPKVTIPSGSFYLASFHIFPLDFTRLGLRITQGLNTTGIIEKIFIQFKNLR